MSSIARTAATGGELDPSFLRWSSSLPIDRRLLAVDCRGSIAHVAGLRRAGLITDDEARVLTEALGALPDRVELGDVELPEEEDVHMAVEALLRAELGAVADKLHTGRSRNDQVAVDLALWCRDSIDRVNASIDGVLAAATAWKRAHGKIPMPSYTHRQVAVPTLAAVWLEAAVELGLRRDQALLTATLAELCDSPLGAGAVGGTTLPLDPDSTGRDLGFAGGPVNTIDAVHSRDYALTLAFVCARIGLHLARFAADVVEMCSDRLCELGGSIACGSSMMPHKRNPDLFELVRGQAALRQAELVGLLTTFHGLGSGYHRDLQHDKQILFAAVDGTCDSLSMIALGLSELVPNRDTCLAALADGDAIATDLTEALVASGVPFREAYQRIGALVASQRAAGKRLVDLTRDELVNADLPESLLNELDLEASARRRAGDG